MLWLALLFFFAPKRCRRVNHEHSFITALH